MFGCMAGEPVLAAKGIFSYRLHPVAREPVGPFPAVLNTKASALRSQTIVQRTLAEAAAGFNFTIRPSHLIVKPQDFGDALTQKCAVVRPRREATDIDGPKVHGLFTSDYPFGEILPCPSGRSDANRVEASEDEKISQFRRFAHQKIIVRRKTFGAIDEFGELGGL